MKHSQASSALETRFAKRRRRRRLVSCLLWTLAACAVVFAARPHDGEAAQPRSNETSRPELVLQTGHAMRVDGLAFSPDARLVASGSKDNTVRLWDVERALELRKLSGHAAWVKAVAFSPDGKLLATGAVDGVIKLWEVATGRELKSLSGGGSINALAFSPDARLVATGNAENSVQLRNAQTGQAERTLAGHTGAVLSLAFSPDGKLLATGARDNSVKLWDTATGRETHTLAGHGDRVRTLAFSPDSRRLASGSSDRTIKLWDAAKGRETRTLAGMSDAVVAVAFTDDGRNVLAAGATSRALVRFDAESGKQLAATSDAESLDTLEAATFSADGKLVATSSGDKTVVVRDVSAPKVERVFETRASGVYATAFSPDGKWFASGSKDNTVRLWEAATGRELLNLAGHIGVINSVAFSPDSRTIAAGGLSGGVKLWEVLTGRELAKLSGHAESVNAVAFNAAGVLASASNDRTIKLWDTTAAAAAAAAATPPRELRTLAGHGGEVHALAFNPDGTRLASGSSNGEVKIWNTSDGQPVGTPGSHRALVASVAFSPDGKTLASASYDQTTKVWDAASGTPARTLNGANGFTSVAFMRDGQTLLAGNLRGEIKFWNAATGQDARPVVNAHTDAINALALSRDGRWLVSGSEDGSVRVWAGDDNRGELLATLVSLLESADWLVVAPDGLFDGSPAAWNQIMWRFEGNTLNVRPVEVFFNEYYYPGLLGDIFAGRRPQAAKDIAARDRRQPQVQLSLAGAPDASSVKTKTVKLRIEVEEANAPDARYTAGSGAQDLRLFRNGLLVRLWRGNVFKEGGSKIVVETDVPVVAGENQLTAYAFNRDNVKSVDAQLLVTGDASLRRAGTAYILAVGVNKYANPAFNLNFANADAQVFGEEVQRAQARLDGFAKIEVVHLFDAESTKANLLGAIKRLGGDESALPPGAPPALARLKRAQPEDTVILYYAGHGIAQGQRFYIIPHDLGYAGDRTKIDAAGMRTLLAHSLSDRELEAALDGVDAAQAVLVLDACNSGQALEAEDKRLGPMNSKGLAQLAYEKGMFILTAAQGYQAAKEATQLGHGLLTYALVVQGLKEGAADMRPRDGQVLMGEWLDYATERVPLMQLESMKKSRGLLGQAPAPPLAFVDGEQRVVNPENRSLQRPRVFYRRELAARPLVVTKVQTGAAARN